MKEEKHTRAVKHDSTVEQQKLKKTGKTFTSRNTPSHLQNQRPLQAISITFRSPKILHSCLTLV